MALKSILDLSTEVKPFVSPNGSTEDALLDMLRKWTENQARQFVGHTITQETITNEYQRRDDIGFVDNADLIEVIGDTVHIGRRGGFGGHVLQLDNAFVRSVSDLREDSNARFGTQAGDFAAATALVEGTDFHLELDVDGLSKSGRILRQVGNWSSRPGTIRITYVCGFTPIELNDEYSFIKQALLEDVQAKFQHVLSQRSSGGGPLKKKSYVGDVSYEYAVSTGGAAKGLIASSRAKLIPVTRLKLS